MAIIYKKGEPLQYTGFDKVQYTLGNTIEKIKSLPRRILDRQERKSKEWQEMKRKKNERLIINTFGSVENYQNFVNKTK